MALRDIARIWSRSNSRALAINDSMVASVQSIILSSYNLQEQDVCIKLKSLDYVIGGTWAASCI